IVAAVDMFDRELVSLELILALHRISAGAGDRDPDEHRGARRAGGIGADRRVILRINRHDDRSRQQRATGEAGSGPQQGPARHARSYSLTQFVGVHRSTSLSLCCLLSRTTTPAAGYRRSAHASRPHDAALSLARIPL